MSQASVSAVVYGRVQGVFFRGFVSRRARALGLTGYVRNLPQGGVEVRAEGESEKLEELVEHLRVGPPGARVERVEVNWSEPTGGLSHFEIRY
jgi:acylphosphatase